MNIFDIKEDLRECTRHLSQYLNGERHFWRYSCFENIEERAKWAYNYIVTNNDIETALSLAKLDRSCWKRIQRDPNLRDGECEMLKSVAQTLYNIFIWYLDYEEY